MGIFVLAEEFTLEVSEFFILALRVGRLRQGMSWVCGGVLVMDVLFPECYTLSTLSAFVLPDRRG